MESYTNQLSSWVKLLQPDRQFQRAPWEGIDFIRPDIHVYIKILLSPTMDFKGRLWKYTNHTLTQRADNMLNKENTRVAWAITTGSDGILLSNPNNTATWNSTTRVKVVEDLLYAISL